MCYRHTGELHWMHPTWFQMLIMSSGWEVRDFTLPFPEAPSADVFSKALYMELFNSSPWSITEHIRTFGAYIWFLHHLPWISFRNITSIRLVTKVENVWKREKFVPQEWTETNIKGDVKWRMMPIYSQSEPSSSVWRPSVSSLARSFSKHGLPKQPQLLGALLLFGGGLFFLLLLFWKKWKQKKTMLPRHAR